MLHAILSLLLAMPFVALCVFVVVVFLAYKGRIAVAVRYGDVAVMALLALLVVLVLNLLFFVVVATMLARA